MISFLYIEEKKTMTQQGINQLHTLANKSKGFTFIGKEPIESKGFKFSGTLDFEPAPPVKAPTGYSSYLFISIGVAVIIAFLIMKLSQ